jgi:hypothetical protein
MVGNTSIGGRGSLTAASGTTTTRELRYWTTKTTAAIKNKMTQTTLIILDILALLLVQIVCRGTSIGYGDKHFFAQSQKVLAIFSHNA